MIKKILKVTWDEEEEDPTLNWEGFDNLNTTEKMDVLTDIGVALIEKQKLTEMEV